ncbi:MAG: RIP metalloprotease RseP [Ignavibacteriales bacterium]|nr:RIP metalloprotease RseP [Ignavibacteriales bacterium]
MEFLTTTFYFIITIGILVFIHELGHFLAAKLCKMRVDRFSIGFPPRAFGKQIGETDYCVSWIPIGGYVKIAGMVDESFDTDYLEHPPEPWEFRSKPIWQRMFVLSAGVLMNILLAIVIFWGINFVQGEYFRQTTDVGYVAPKSAAEKSGFLSGDKIQSINGTAVEYWEAIQNTMYMDRMGEDLTFDILRNGTPLSVHVPRTQIPDIANEQFGLLPSHTEALITDVVAGKPAHAAGLQRGDVVLSINGTIIANESHLVSMIKSHPSQTISIQWKRDSSIMRSRVTPSSEGLIGIAIQGHYTGPVLHHSYGIVRSLPKGITDVYGATTLFVHSIWQIIAGKVSFTKSVGGPIKIAQFATRSAEVGLLSFLAFVALLSISLAVMNILPFPALDGGHIVLLAYEAIFRKPLPQRVQQWIQQAGMILLFAFMAFVMYNDLVGF